MREEHSPARLKSDMLSLIAVYSKISCLWQLQEISEWEFKSSQLRIPLFVNSCDLNNNYYRHKIAMEVAGNYCTRLPSTNHMHAFVEKGRATLLYLSIQLTVQVSSDEKQSTVR